MKINIKYILILIISTFSIIYSAQAQNQITRNVFNAIKKGNSSELSKYFNNNIQLKINSKSNVYSKTQAEKILNNFFTQHQPKQFTIDSEKLRGEATVTLGILNTETNNYRIIYRIVPTEGKNTITYMEIETI